MTRKTLPVLSIVVLIIIIAAGLFWWRMPEIEKDGYQGVIMNSGMAYYGHLQNAGEQYLKLTDVYYLQQSTKTGQPPLNLIKFGTEPQGPQDKMFINRSQVQYWYNLNEQGELYQKIMLAKEQQSQQPKPAATPATPAKK